MINWWLTHTGGITLIYKWSSAPSMTTKCFIEDFEKSYTPCVVVDVINDYRVCLPTAKSFLDLARKEHIMGVSLTDMHITYTMYPYQDYLEAALNGSGVLPIETKLGGGVQIYLWCPDMPDRIIMEALTGDYTKLVENGLPMLQADVKSAKAAMLYGVRTVIYDNQLLLLENVDNTTRDIPLYNLCNSISQVCIFVKPWFSATLNLLLNDEMLENLLQSKFLDAEWILAVSNSQFSVSKCSQQAIIKFVLATYKNKNRLTEFVSMWADCNFTAYYELALFHAGNSKFVYFADSEFYASLTEDSRMTYFTIIDEFFNSLKKIDDSPVKYDITMVLDKILSESDWAGCFSISDDLVSQPFDVDALLKFGNYAEDFSTMLDDLDSLILSYEHVKLVRIYTHSNSFIFLRTLVSVSRLSSEAQVGVPVKYRDYLAKYGAELIDSLKSRNLVKS